jgi:hypothetical protein
MMTDISKQLKSSKMKRSTALKPLYREISPQQHLSTGLISRGVFWRRRIKFGKNIKIFLVVACLNVWSGPVNLQAGVAAATAASTNNDALDHGWAMLDSVRSFMVYPVTFYALSRGLMSRLHDGMVVRIKSLKTGFGSYYKLEKDANGAWALDADTKDPKEPACQFLVTLVNVGVGNTSSNYVTLTSETAGGLLLASDPKTFDVTLVAEQDVKNDKSKTDSTLWELVEDPSCGDTLDSCFLRNKLTKGLLTASYDDSGDCDAQMADLKSKIDPLEKATPYLTITSTSIEGGGKSMVDAITQKIQPYVLDAIGQKIDVSGVGGVFAISGNNWAESMCGVSHKSWQVKTGRLIHSRSRNVQIKYMEGADKIEKILNTNESATVKLVADVTKHPAWPYRQKLNDLTKKMQEMGALKNSDVGRTGFNGMPFGTNLKAADVQWSKVAIEPVVDVGQDNNADTESKILPAAQEGGFVKTDLDNIWIHKNPEFEGSFKQTIPFGPGQVITANPLCSKGFVWLSQTFQTAGYGAVTFRALTQESDIQICFSDAVEPKTVYRIVFGAAANTKTVIYKNEIPVQEIDNDQSKWARVSPGTIASFWVSLNNGFIIVGKGDPGTRIIMAWQDPNPAANITQIGFSTYKSVVKYTDVQIIDNPVVVVAPVKSYITDSAPIQVGTVAAPAWHRLPLSPPDSGTVVFQATGTEDATLILANDKNEGYAISFGCDGNTAAKIVALEDQSKNQPENQQELYKIDVKSTPLAALDVGKPNKFWVSFYKGLIILGKGDVGKSTFCIYADNDAPDGIYKIGFAGKSALQNLEIWPAVGLGFDQNVAQYVKQHQNSPLQGVLNIITPFDYEINQQGPIIVFKDRITGMSTNIAGTPDPGLVYHFTLDIAADGSPNLIAGANSQTPAKIAMGASVKALEAAKDIVLTAQMTAAYEAGQLPDDPLEIDVAIAAVMLIAAAASGGVGSALAGAQAGVQSKLDEMNKLGGRKINTEKVIRMAGGSSTVSDEVKNNRTAFDAAMKAIFGPLPDSPNDPKSIAKRDEAGKLDYITGLWQDALELITDAYVVGDPGTKKSVISGLSDLYNRVIALGFTDDTFALYTRMMNILIKAYNSPYLTSFGDPADDQNRSNWYLWINNLAKQFFSSQAINKQGVTIDFKGEYLWFPTPFAQTGSGSPTSGSVTFEVQASGDVFVCFSENPNQTSDMLKRIYEIDFGAWENKTTVIHRTALGDSVVEFDQEKITGLSLDPMIFKKYWINFDNGVFSGGVGDLGQNKLWEWTDPYTPVPVKWIGFSNWLTAVTIRNVVVGAVIGK